MTSCPSMLRWRFLRSLMALWALLALGCPAGSSRAQRSPTARVVPQALQQAAQSYLRSAIECGNLAELRWPNFREYRKDVASFYAHYGYALPWVSDLQPTPQARAVVRLLENADAKGLSSKDYDGPKWAARMALLRPRTPRPVENDAVHFDLALTISLMRYISDLHTGRIDPHQFDIVVNIAQRKYNLAKFLEENVVHAANVPASLVQVEPPYPGYQRTMDALQRYRNLAKRHDTGQPFPRPQGAIAPGQTYGALPRLARFLHLVGDLPKNVHLSAHHQTYQGALVRAVRRFQDRHGLDPDGRIGPRTIAALNVPLSERVRQIELTLERWRWLPAEYGESPIIVNIPEFRLRAYDKNFRPVVTMKVVVGKAYDHNTPIFMSKLKSVIFRPAWDVPLSIVRAEIVPALERDPDYLKKENMEIVQRSGRVIPQESVTRTLLDDLRGGELFVRQQPGPNNSLGLVEFDFPNVYSVYMHDTPARTLFSKSKRDFSHGCIRLEKPAQLAAWVLRHNPGWDAAHIRAAMQGDRTQEVRLTRPIPVLIVYGTVIVRDDGLVRFYEDLYGQDAWLDFALRHDYPYPHESLSGARSAHPRD